MRTHTQAFKDGIKEYGRQFNDIIYHNGNTYDGERINSVNYTVDTNLMKSVMQTLKIDTDIPVAKGDTLDYGISLEGVTGSEIRFNNFIVDKIDDQKDKNSKLVTCYDNMLKTMKEYENPGVTYPVTVRYYINAICTHLGLTFKNASDTFTNYNKQITSEHYVDTDGRSLGYTFRDVLDDLAEATGSFICIDNTGKLEIRSVTNTNDTIDEEYFKDKNVTVGAKYGPINVVILSRGDDSDNLVRPTGTLPDPKIEIKIADNPILDQDNREDFIDGIYNQLNGLEYYISDFATNGILYYEVGDKFNVSIDNTTYQCLMLADNIKRTTGLSEKIYTKEPSKSVTDYKYVSDTDKVGKTSRNAWIKANKAEGTAEMIVQGIGSQGQVTGASVIAAINGDQSNLSLNADKINLNGAVTANNNFKINTDGSVELNDAIIDIKDTGQGSTPAVQVTRSGNINNFSIMGSYGFIHENTYDNSDRDRLEMTGNDIIARYEEWSSDRIRQSELTPYGVYASYEDVNNSNNDKYSHIGFSSIELKSNATGNYVDTFNVQQGDYTANMYLSGDAQINGNVSVGGNLGVVGGIKNITFKGGTGPGNTNWHAIGEIQYDNHTQGSFCNVKIILGNGNNGTGNQNAWIDLYMQLGWTGSLDGRFGCYAYYHPGLTNMNTSNTQIKIMANSNISYGIYLYSEWGYCCPNVIAYLPQNAHFYQQDTWTTSPSGTECDLQVSIGNSVVEKGGVSGNNYILYEDGRMEAWKVVSGTTNINTAWGSCYTSGSSNTINLGNWYRNFQWEPDDVQVTVRRGNSNLIFGSIEGITSSFAGYVSLLRFTSATNVAYTLYVHATGWWR